MKNLRDSIAIIDKDVEELILRVERSLEIVNELLIKEGFDNQLYGECRIIEEEADDLEVAIDEKVINAIARYQPAAGDLRYLVKVQEISTDLERISDLCVGIVKLIKDMDKDGSITSKNITYLDQLAEKVIYIFKLYRTSFVQKKIDHNYMILGLDEEIDGIRDECIILAKQKMTEEKNMILAGINNIIIAQKFERIADIIENLAESYVYISKGIDIRHKNLTE
jgi:phosphate transport system protein